MYLSQGRFILFSNTTFIQLVIDFFYGEGGIAALKPASFGDYFPLAALVLVRSLVRFSVLSSLQVTECDELRQGTHC